MVVATVDERIRARVCCFCIWGRNELRQQCRLRDRFYGGQTMQGREKPQCRQQFRQILADVLDVSRHVRQRGRKV